LSLTNYQHFTTGAIFLSIVATLAMMAALVGTLYPVPEPPYNWLPYLFLVYLAGGLIFFSVASSRRTAED